MKELSNLNLANNLISVVENLAGCVELSTLTLSGNKLKDVKDMMHLTQLSSVTYVTFIFNQLFSVLDLQDNDIEDESLVKDVLSQMKNLRVLYMKGNSIQKNMKYYRKTLIASLPNLQYLDDRPVFEDERRWVTAWSTGGLEAEQEERRKIIKEKENRHKASVDGMLFYL